MQVDEAPAVGCAIRVVSIYATRWRHAGKATEESQLNLQLNLQLGRLEDFYAFYKDQLPRGLHTEEIPVEDVKFEADVPGVTLTKVETWLFALPSNQVVMALALSFRASRPADDTRPTALVLERCVHAALSIGGRSLPDYVQGLAGVVGAVEIGSEKAPLLPERHQLVFVPRLSTAEEPPKEHVISEIVYLTDPPYREEFTPMQRPEQLNLTRPRRTVGVVTPYVSFIYGHERFVEDSIFLSTVHAVGTASRFRQIWHEAYRHVRDFRDHNQATEAGVQTRNELEVLADYLGNLEFDLTFSVEFPLMRIESFHSALYGAMDLPNQAQTLSQMFTQLGGSLRSEITAIDIRERRRENSRQKWNAIAASVLSLIGVPVSFVLAFLGINASQVDQNHSMLDVRYRWMYIAAAVLALLPVSFISWPYIREWFRQRVGLPTLVTGLLLLVAGLPITMTAATNYQDRNATFDLGDFTLTVIGSLFSLVGLVMSVRGLLGLLARGKGKEPAAPHKQQASQ
jgi:hypothetical protein